MAETPLDRARAALAAAPDDQAARLALFGAFSEAEIVVVLAGDPEDEAVQPKLARLDGVPHVLAYSDEVRLAEDLREPAPCATLPGRALAGLLAGQGVGIALDPGDEALVLSPEEVDWLARTLNVAPEPASGRPLAVAAPEVSDASVGALGQRLAASGALAEAAWLVKAAWPDDRRGPLLVFVGAAPGAERALAAAAGEAVAFSGGPEDGLDVAFVDGGAALLREIEAVGRAIPLPKPAPPTAPAAPGSDPDRPPRLR